MCNLYVLIDIFEELVSVVIGEDVIALVEFVCDGWIGYSAYMSDLWALHPYSLSIEQTHSYVSKYLPILCLSK